MKERIAAFERGLALVVALFERGLLSYRGERSETMDPLSVREAARKLREVRARSARLAA